MRMMFAPCLCAALTSLQKNQKNHITWIEISFLTNLPIISYILKQCKGRKTEAQKVSIRSRNRIKTTTELWSA